MGTYKRKPMKFWRDFKKQCRSTHLEITEGVAEIKRSTLFCHVYMGLYIPGPPIDIKNNKLVQLSFPNDLVFFFFG